MSTKISTRQSKKPVVAVSSAKPKVTNIGIIHLKRSRMIFDDSTYVGKYVFSLTDDQLKYIVKVEHDIEELQNFSAGTKRKWSTNDYGNQIKLNGDPRLLKGTYNLTLVVAHWTFQKECGINYTISESESVEADPVEPRIRPELASLGEC